MIRRAGWVAPAILVAAAAAGIAPVSAVPTGTYDETGALRIFAQPGDDEVSVTVDSDHGSLGPVKPYTRVFGDVELTSGGPCTATPRGYDCPFEPWLVLLDGGPAHADLSAYMFSESVDVVLRAGERGGRLKTDAQEAKLIGRGGPDHVVYVVRYTSSPGRFLVLRTAAGDDVVVLDGVSSTSLVGTDGKRARVVLGSGDDRFVARTPGPSPVRVYGRTGRDVVKAGLRDVVLGGAQADSLSNGRTLIGGRGHDELFGGTDTRLIRAVDGMRDVVACRSKDTVVRADRLDAVSGPCRVLVNR